MSFKPIKSIILLFGLFSITLVGFASEESNSGAIKPEWIAFNRANLGDSSFDVLVAIVGKQHLDVPEEGLKVIEKYCNNREDKKALKWADKVLKKTKQPDAQWMIAAYIYGQGESPPLSIEQVLKSRFGYAFDPREATGCLKYNSDLRVLGLNIPIILETTFPMGSFTAEEIEYQKHLLGSSLSEKEVEELSTSLRSDLENGSFTSPEENYMFANKVIAYMNATGDSQFLSDLWNHPGEYPRFVALQVGTYASDPLLVQTILGHIQEWRKEEPEEFLKAYNQVLSFIEEQAGSPNVREALEEWLLPYGLGEDAQRFIQRGIDILGSQRWPEIDQERNRSFLAMYNRVQEIYLKKSRASKEKIKEFNLRQPYRQ